ncbi:hypothetical protein [Streptomyces sp. NPDC001435]|uniref:hypothetical protein n=1 Tax=Streptomyces sp. NPDC001435 TaxID=3364576 RepID=UPI0036C5126F
METDGEQQVQRPGDDEFWAGLHWSVTSGRAGLLEETYVEGASRRHRLTSATIDSVRAGIAPRARPAVWPDLSSDIELADPISGAETAALLSAYTDERVPLFTAVMPDADALVRARRRTDPTPGWPELGLPQDPSAR